MNFLQSLKSSVYDPKFYAGIKKQSLGQALKYFFFLILGLTILNTLILSYELGVKVPQEIRNFVSQMANSYPADLEVKIENGKVVTNAKQPFFIPFPQGENINNESLNNFLVIDTETPYSAPQFQQYKTLAWLTKDSLFYQNNDYSQRSIDLSDVQNVTINRSFVQNILNQISPWFNAIGPVLILTVFIGLYIGFIFNLIYFLLLAVLIYFLASIFKWGLNYGASFRTAIYASTLAFLVDLVIFNTGLWTGFFGFPFMFTLIALCVATINLQNIKENG